MVKWKRQPGGPFLVRQEGGITVEFALLLPILLLLAFGIIDLGHAWYMQQQITSASREGARYGSRYQTNALGGHLLPNALNPSIGNWVKAKYASLLPADAELSVTPGGPGYSSGLPGDDLLVTVAARKHWFLLGALLPGLGDYKDLIATTVMKCE